MVARGYCTLDQVAAWNGTALTAEQAAAVTTWMELAEALIDGTTGHPFLTPASGVVIGERHQQEGPRFWLRQRPISNVLAVRGYFHGNRYGLGDPTPVTLAAGPDYEIESLDRARLYIRPWRVWDYFQIDYTAAIATVPVEISEATALLLTHMLVHPQVVQSGTLVGQQFADVQERYAKPTSADITDEGGLPPDVQAWLGRWSRSEIAFG